MEALTAVTVTALTIYDMAKSADRWMTIESIQLEGKRGGKSGTVTRPPAKPGSTERTKQIGMRGELSRRR
jgi:hypothetical protein